MSRVEEEWLYEKGGQFYKPPPIAQVTRGYNFGEIRPDLDALLASDSVCLRTSSCLPQSGDM